VRVGEVVRHGPSMTLLVLGGSGPVAPSVPTQPFRQDGIGRLILGRASTESWHPSNKSR
jgi:hypothetical protein